MYGQQGAGPDGAAPGGGATGTDSAGGAEDVVDAEIVDEGDKK